MSTCFSACSRAFAVSQRVLEQLGSFCTKPHAAISSADLIARWQGAFLQVQAGDGNAQSSTTAVDMSQIRQLCQDAIQVYSAEGAASVVPDRVADILMAAYTHLSAPQHKLAFFKLLVAEFGVQRQAVDEAVQLWLNRSISGHEPASSSGGNTNSTGSTSVSTSNSTSSSSSDSNSNDSQPTALMYRLAERLSAAAQPLYLQLLLPIAQHRSGIAFLVNLRGDLLQLLQQQPVQQLGMEAVALRALDQHLRAALARWFSLGLLQLQRITWEHSSGQLLQRVQLTEAVHKMAHLEELQRRLQQSDRRVYAFMHPSLPSEPLVVLHTAILGHIPSSMQEVWGQQQGQQGQHLEGDRGREQHLDRDGGSSAMSSNDSSSACSSSGAAVACFYSISSSQKGLSGVDLGNFLIKKAAQLLLSEMPQLQTLVTLSPIPGFRAWLITRLRQAMQAGDSSSSGGSGSSTASSSTLEAAGGSTNLLRDADVAAVLSIHPHSSTAAAAGGGGNNRDLSSSSSSSSGRNGVGSRSDSSSSDHAAAAASVLLSLVEGQQHGWLSLPLQQQEQVLRPLLLRLCAHYLLTERRRNHVLDPVAHFHLRNGAELWRINWRADMSPQGLSNSCGLMVNYRYDMGRVAANNQSYLLEHTIQASAAVQQLL